MSLHSLSLKKIVVMFLRVIPFDLLEQFSKRSCTLTSWPFVKPSYEVGGGVCVYGWGEEDITCNELVIPPSEMNPLVTSRVMRLQRTRCTPVTTGQLMGKYVVTIKVLQTTSQRKDDEMRAMKVRRPD